EDLRFIDADGTALAYEIESWNVLGESNIWVRVPRIDASSNTDSIWMYYGNGAAAADQHAAEVWSADYRGVYHLNENPSAAGALGDSTANNFNGTNVGSTNFAGVIGNAQDFDGVSQYVNLGTNRAFIDGASAVTMSAWINLDVLSADQSIVSTSINNGGTGTTKSRVVLTLNGSEVRLSTRANDSGTGVVTMVTTTSPLLTNVWYHVVGVVDFANDSAAIYVDGVAQALSITPSYTETATPNATSDNASIGAEDDGSNDFINGRIDEVRVSLGARSANWVKAQNLSMTDNFFLAYGAVESATALSGALANDSDADGDLINAQLVSGPANATAFTFNRDGTFNYTPQTGFVGTDTFTYRLTDGMAFGEDYATVTITVGVVPDLIVDTTSEIEDGDTTSIANLLANKGADGFISIREAITATNNTVNTSGPDVIHFNIGGGGLQTINLTGADPGITDAVIIDGTSQPGFSGEPLIQLYGDGVSDAGLELRAGSDGSTIRGLVISNFGVHGVRVASSNNLIAGNWIGLGTDGISAVGNGSRGIFLVAGADNNTIGGVTAADRNVISGNSAQGINIQGNNNVVIGNYIGTDKSGTVSGLGNASVGIRIRNGASGNTIGGTAAGEGNVVADNALQGVVVSDGGTGNQILGNSIYANAGIGIDLDYDGVTSNDSGDLIPGSNDLQNYPVITTAFTTGANITIYGTLNSTATEPVRIEFFSNSAADPSGYGEGETYLGF
ncbi:MAG: DUF2341 domain-containing protein, partial [Pirellulales bacterium]